MNTVYAQITSDIIGHDIGEIVQIANVDNFNHPGYTQAEVISLDGWYSFVSKKALSVCEKPTDAVCTPVVAETTKNLRPSTLADEENLDVFEIVPELDGMHYRVSFTTKEAQQSFLDMCATFSSVEVQSYDGHIFFFASWVESF